MFHPTGKKPKIESPSPPNSRPGSPSRASGGSIGGSTLVATQAQPQADVASRSASPTNGWEGVEWEDASEPLGTGPGWKHGELTITMPPDGSNSPEHGREHYVEPPNEVETETAGASDEERAVPPGWVCPICNCALGKRVGGGDNATIYENAHQPDQVVKLSLDERGDMELENEAEIYQRLAGSNVSVGCISSCLVEEHPHLVLEKADRTLGAYLRDPEITEAQQAAMQRSVGDKIENMHAKQVAHNDLYDAEMDIPRFDNVMIKGHEPYMVDFGAATDESKSFPSGPMRGDPYRGDKRFLEELKKQTSRKRKAELGTT